MEYSVQAYSVNNRNLIPILPRPPTLYVVLVPKIDTTHLENPDKVSYPCNDSYSWVSLGGLVEASPGHAEVIARDYLNIHRDCPLAAKAV